MAKGKHTLTITIKCESAGDAVDILNKLKSVIEELAGVEIELEPTDKADSAQRIVSIPYTSVPPYLQPPYTITCASTSVADGYPPDQKATATFAELLLKESNKAKL